MEEGLPMSSKCPPISPAEVRRVYELLEKLQELFHQPLYYEDPGRVRKFAEANYGEIRELYYNVVWEWLPEDLRKELADDA